MCCARYCASSLTQPSSADPLVCCQGRPRKYRPGVGCHAALVRDPRLDLANTGRSTQVWSRPNPVAQITASTDNSVLSAKLTARPEGVVVRGLMANPVGA